ncbi:hypothetical protein NECAME_13935, partial [Necator americanus]
MCNLPNEELWEVKFRPVSCYSKFEVRSLISRELEPAELLHSKKTTADPDHIHPAGFSKPTVAYVPPHLRKAQITGSVGIAKSMQVTPAKMSDTDKKILMIKKKLKDIATLK